MSWRIYFRFIFPYAVQECLINPHGPVLGSLFGPFWKPWGHLRETFGKIDAKIDHFGTRGTTKNVTFLCFVSDPDNFLRFLAPFWILFDDFFYILLARFWILVNILKRGQGRAQRGRRPDHSVDALRFRRLSFSLALIGSHFLEICTYENAAVWSSLSLSFSLSLSLSLSLRF